MYENRPIYFSLSSTCDGHALILTKRHVATWFDASREEQTELVSALAIAKEAISSKHRSDETRSARQIPDRFSAPAGPSSGDCS
jgi:diadenosine tetraphosphate (Ap4A) HIT family hydrolase